MPPDRSAHLVSDRSLLGADCAVVPAVGAAAATGSVRHGERALPWLAAFLNAQVTKLARGGARSDLGDIPAGVVGSYMGVLLVMEFFTIEAHQHPQ